MATVKKGMLTPPNERWKHLRWAKRAFWKGERQAARSTAGGGDADSADDEQFGVVWRHESSDGTRWVEISRRPDDLYVFDIWRREDVTDPTFGNYVASYPVGPASGLYVSIEDARREALSRLDRLDEA